MTSAEAEKLSAGQRARKRAAGLLARASAEELGSALNRIAPDEAVSPLRGPETGLVMLRGRIGGGGAAFNLGEATASRASVRLGDGRVGHGYCLGADRSKAQMIAILDALMQRPDLGALIETTLLAPLGARIAAERNRQAEETAATRVDFFTMVRGED
ncbi:phosphonate C-P lyase system protein PhnG [Martelella alba]|uniref:Phosphonate C-P lyase system protein PhnG n=1 Tax=Martelella alba TaxID=2590451 RepID=A0A506UFJ7_9HYPH|nr:phosphonate C-P lyase system protein PhnG [Martelella alba]TPW32336.1 phosphonate C-P lyase system protein PhnG [Martelella alba]